MFCTHCGKQMEAGARFCPQCGTVLASAAPTGQLPPPYQRMGGITRPRYPRVIAGVCSGIAQHLGWDVTLVRLVWVLAVIFAGTGLLAYVIAWIVIPEAPYTLPVATGSTSV